MAFFHLGKVFLSLNYTIFKLKNLSNCAFYSVFNVQFHSMSNTKSQVIQPYDLKLIQSSFRTVCPIILVTVRHTPLQAILSPMFVSCKTSLHEIASCIPSGLRQICVTTPNSSMIPVNIWIFHLPFYFHVFATK